MTTEFCAIRIELTKGIVMKIREIMRCKSHNRRSFHLIALALAAIIIIRSSTPDCKAAISTLSVSSSSITVCDSSGNIWAVWHAGPAGNRDIYIGKLAVGADTFGNSIRLTDNMADQLNPAIALGADGKLYVVWQDNRRGNWDIYGATSEDGTNWSAEQQIVDSDNDDNYNQINPTLAVDNRYPNHAYVVWQDDRSGNQDIYIAESSDAFTTCVSNLVTPNAADQTGPAIAVDSYNRVYVLWTDTRNVGNGTDIYGACGSPWINIPVVRKPANQSNPQIALESSGSVLHMLWVDQELGNSDIYYAWSLGMPGSPLAGYNLVDDTLNAEQLSPAIAVIGEGSELQVFACWQDERNISGGTGDMDLYMVQVNSGSGTNIYVGDGGTNSDQTEPAIGIDWCGYPYIIWTDYRNAETGIYYAGSAYTEPTPLLSGLITATTGGTIGTDDVLRIRDVDDVSITIPAGACPYDVEISITRMVNPHNCNMPWLNGYQFSPSGLKFAAPVTITIPYLVSDASDTSAVYWYDSNIGSVNQEGISNVEIIKLSSNLHAIRFTTTHLTRYYALLEADDNGKGGGNNGKNDKSQKGRENNNGGGKKKNPRIASDMPDLFQSKTLSYVQSRLKSKEGYSGFPS